MLKSFLRPPWIPDDDTGKADIEIKEKDDEDYAQSFARKYNKHLRLVGRRAKDPEVRIESFSCSVLRMCLLLASSEE